MTDPTDKDRMEADEERARAALRQLRGVHAFDLAHETVVGLLSFGTQKMGLIEETREIRDLEDARVSVELVRGILDVLERETGDDRAHGLRDALAQMQLAYAHAVQLARAERDAAGEAPAPAQASGDAPADADSGAATMQTEQSADAAPGTGASVDEPSAGESAAHEPGAEGPATRKRTRKAPAGKSARKKKPAAGA